MKNSFLSFIKKIFGITENVLRLASKNVTIFIPACDGSKLLRNAGVTFHFENKSRCLAADNPPNPTEEADVEVYTLDRPADAKDIFESIAANNEELCFTEHQIITFCEMHPEWLGKTSRDYALFLYKSPYFDSPHLAVKHKFHIAQVTGIHYSGKLSLYIDYLNDNSGHVGVNTNLKYPDPTVYVVVPK